MIARILSAVGSIPHALMLKAIAIGLVFMLGLSLGNHHATQAALKRELQASADRQRENHKQLLAYQKDVEKRLKAEAEQQHNADMIAYNELQDGKAEAEAGRRDAERRLAVAFADAAKLRMTNDGLKEVNNLLAATESRVGSAATNSDAGCIMPPGVRQAIDGYIASVNSGPFIGVAEAEASGVPTGTIETHPPITCRELAASVIDIIQHDAEQIGLNASWRVWAEEALK